MKVQGQVRAEAVFFLIFMLVTKFVFVLANAALKWLEKRKFNLGKRHFNCLQRVPFHPAVLLVVSAATTIAIVNYLLYLEGPLDAYSGMANSAATFFGYPIYIIGILYLICGLVLGATIINALRRFFRGTVSPQNMERDLDNALRAILAKRAPSSLPEALLASVSSPAPKADDTESRVTFGQLKAATKISLSIVTSDIIKNEVAVFSSETHPDYPVAKAVGASLAIPFAFRPVLDGTRYLMDGGLISSLPAWVYRRHRTRDPDCRILAIGIEPDEYDLWIPEFLMLRRKWLDESSARSTWPMVRRAEKLIGRLRVIRWAPFISLFWPFRIAVNVASTAAFGGRSLDLDASDRLDSFSLRPTVGLLDFDMKPKTAKSEIDALKIEASLSITNLLWRRKIAFRNVCSTIEKVLRERTTTPPTGGIIRMFWAERDGSAEAVRIKFVYGFDKDHLDDRIVMPFGSSMTAWAAQLERSQFAYATTLKKMFDQPMNRYRKVVRWTGSKWCWAIPVFFENGKLSGVFAIESSFELSEFDPVVGAIANERSKAWLDEAGDLRQQDGAIVPPAPIEPKSEMAQLELVLADLVRREFVILRNPETNRTTVPQPETRSLFILTTKIFALLRVCGRAVREAWLRVP